MATQVFFKSSLCSLTFLMVAASTTVAFCQGSGSSRVDPPRATRPQTPEEFHKAFWSHIVKRGAAYNTWDVLPTEKIEHGVENPHSAFSKTHANKVAAADRKTLPNGSVLVREDYDNNRKRLSISVMYRVKSYDNDHGDWYWIRYLENGSVARGDDNKPLIGKVSSCCECHTHAGDKDFVFSNDEAKGEHDAKLDDTLLPPEKAPQE